MTFLKKGFSLVEIIVAMAIGAVLVAGIVVSFSSFRNSKIVDISYVHLITFL